LPLSSDCIGGQRREHHPRIPNRAPRSGLAQGCELPSPAARATIPAAPLSWPHGHRRRESNAATAPSASLSSPLGCQAHCKSARQRGGREITVPSTTSATAEFFDGLAERGYEPLLGKLTGSARFDVIDNGHTERWLVGFDKGHISVSRRNGAAETVVTSSRESFERAVAGRLNVTAASLRGEIKLSGDPRLLVRLQRLFPRPEDGRAEHE